MMETESLLLYAENKPRHTRCKICLLNEDLRSEIEGSRRINPQKVTYKAITTWLNEHRQEDLEVDAGIAVITKDQVYRHWSSGHVKS